MSSFFPFCIFLFLSRCCCCWHAYYVFYREHTGITRIAYHILPRNDLQDAGDSPDAPQPREMIDMEATFEKLEHELQEVCAIDFISTYYLI